VRTERWKRRDADDDDDDDVDDDVVVVVDGAADARMRDGGVRAKGGADCAVATVRLVTNVENGSSGFARDG